MAERTDTELQAELDAAQSDLEHKIGALKELVDAKLETPKHVLDAVSQPVSWIAKHPLAAVAAALGVGYLIHRVRARARS